MAAGITVTLGGQKICMDALGLCGTDCPERCNYKHPGGQGTCDVQSGYPICICQYYCTKPSPLKPKKIQSGFGPMQ